MAAYTVTVRRTVTHTATVSVSATENTIDAKCDTIIAALDKDSNKFGSQVLDWQLEDEELDIDSADED